MFIKSTVMFNITERYGKLTSHSNVTLTSLNRKTRLYYLYFIVVRWWLVVLVVVEIALTHKSCMLNFEYITHVFCFTRFWCAFAFVIIPKSLLWRCTKLHRHRREINGSRVLYRQNKPFFFFSFLFFST